MAVIRKRRKLSLMTDLGLSGVAKLNTTELNAKHSSPITHQAKSD